MNISITVLYKLKLIHSIKNTLLLSSNPQLHIFRSICESLSKFLFLDESLSFYTSNSVFHFAVAFIQTENFKDIDGPFCLHLKEVQCILLMLKNRLNFDFVCMKIIAKLKTPTQLSQHNFWKSIHKEQRKCSAKSQNNGGGSKRKRIVQ